MVLVIDPQVAGISGDMMLCAMVDMGADPGRVREAVLGAAELAGPGTSVRRLEFTRIQKHGVAATALDVEISEPEGERTGAQVAGCVAAACRKAGLSAAAAGFAERSAGLLVSAEARAHGVAEESVHFHEMASFDTVLDIVGTAAALDDTGAASEPAVAMPLAVGGGTVEFSHGTMSNPAAAILEMLRGTGLRIAGTASGGEAATPTGACMLAALRPECASFYPEMTVDAVGYGAGRRDHPGFANVLKAVRGKASGAGRRDRVEVLETTVDDATGEAMAHMAERAMAAGALDVTVAPVVGKKGRPAHAVTVVCGPGSSAGMASLIMAETGTLGVRIRASDRAVARRSERSAAVEVAGRGFDVRYKVNEDAGTFKVEADDIRRISAATGEPFARADAAARRQVGGALG